MGRDVRVGYVHYHRHSEACDAQPAEQDSTLDSHDRNDKRTGAHRTAGEWAPDRRRTHRRDETAPDGVGRIDGPLTKDGPEEAGGARDEAPRDGAPRDIRPSREESRWSVRDADARGASRERPRCSGVNPSPRRECVEDAPPPYRQEARRNDAEQPAYRPDPYHRHGYRDGYSESRREERREAEAERRDELARPGCGVLCMLRRAKFGHCGAGCSFYRRRYENDGFGEYRRHARRDRDGSGPGGEPEVLK